MRTLDDLNADFDRALQRQACLVTALLAAELPMAKDDPVMLDSWLRSRGVSPQVERLVKAAVPSIGVSSGLAPSQPMVQALLAAADRKSVIGSLGAVRVPSQNAIGATSIAGASAYWIGEAVSTPLSALGFAATSLLARKLVAMLAGSSELFRVANFGDLQVWDRPLVSVVASTLDTTLLDPTNAGITDVKPASLTNGLTTIPPLLDFQNQVGQVLAAICGGSPTKPVLIVSLQTALRLAALPTLTDYVKVLVSPATTNKLIAIDADGVGFVDDGGTVDIGTPDIEMSDTPANPNVASTVMISSWQRNLKVLRCTRWVNWTKRPDAVAMLMLA